VYIKKSDLDFLAEYKGKGAVTIYIPLLPEKSDSDFVSRLTSLTDEASKKLNAHEEREIRLLSGKLSNVKENLLSGFVNNRARTLCVFLSPELLEFIEIPVRIKQQFVINKDFYITPLLKTIEQFNRYAVLVFDGQEAKLYNYFLNEIEEDDFIFHDYVLPDFNTTSGSWKGLKEKTLLNKMDTFYKRHIREVADRLFRHYKSHRFDRLIIASHKEELSSMKEHLHPYLHENLAGEFIAGVEENIYEIKEKTAGVVADYRRSKEEKNVNSLLESIPHKAVLGVREVIDALMYGNAGGVIMYDNFTIEGFKCVNEDFLSVNKPDKKECPYCRNKTVKTLYLEDEIAEFAYARGISVIHLFNRFERFNNYKIGAFLRF